MGDRCHSRAISNNTAMGTGANANIGRIGPIDQVVPTFSARPRMVGHLIGGQAGICAFLIGAFIHVRAQIIRWQTGEPSARIHITKSGVRLDGQLVKGDVVGSQRQGLIQLCLPLGKGLILTAIDQIETNPIKLALWEYSCP